MLQSLPGQGRDTDRVATWKDELPGRNYAELQEIDAGTGARLELYPEQLPGLVLFEPGSHMRNALPIVRATIHGIAAMAADARRSNRFFAVR